MYFATAATLQSRVAGDVHECFLFMTVSRILQELPPCPSCFHHSEAIIE